MKATGLTRAERALADGGFGAAVIAGMTRGSRADVTAARAVQAEIRSRIGYKRASVAVLTSGASQYKLGKNTLPSFGMMLASERAIMSDTLTDVRDAHGMTGAYNVCPLASAGCTAACLRNSGQSGMPKQQRAQAVRTAFLLSHPRECGLILGAEISAALRRHDAINLRLNVTSDLRWEFIAPEMVSALAAAGVRMYDYTAWRPHHRQPSADYMLTYSAKETAHTSDAYLLSVLASGSNVAMPFTTRRGEPLPTVWNGYPVIDGDISDERRLDPTGVVVAWRRDNSAGFIRAAVTL
jgi:hypothetical protein